MIISQKFDIEYDCDYGRWNIVELLRTGGLRYLEQSFEEYRDARKFAEKLNRG